MQELRHAREMNEAVREEGDHKRPNTATREGTHAGPPVRPESRWKMGVNFGVVCDHAWFCFQSKIKGVNSFCLHNRLTAISSIQ